MLQLGLRNCEGRSTPDCGINLQRRLNEVIEQSTRCWICAWLWLLVKYRKAHTLTAISEDQRSEAFLHIYTHIIHTYERGTTFGDASTDTKKLVQIAIALDARQVKQGFHDIVNLQHSQQYPPTLNDLLKHSAIENWSSHIPFDSRLRPRKAELSLLSLWKKECHMNHATFCNIPRTNETRDIRLIDVQERCIVEDAADVPYVALSYCWGGPQLHCLTENNLDAYRQPGGLSSSLIPKVIGDAMIVTTALGERYLWVDSLCIIQSNQLDKTRFLTIMDAIYEQAVVTIVNAATSSVNDSVGLPGISSAAGRREHEPFEINGTWLTETLDPAHSPYTEGGFLRSVHWSTRGWTFQESILSRRMIIVTEQQIYWQCQTSSWCEGSFWERNDNLQIFRHCLGDNTLLALFEQPPRINWTDIYLSIFRHYLTRTFTSEADRLHGLAGILKRIELSSGEKFFWGLPCTRLEQGLSFQTRGWARQRNEFHTTFNTLGVLTSSPFPSWSWLGWKGFINLEPVHRYITIGRIGLHFFRLNESGQPLRIDTPEAPPGPYAEGDVRRITQYPPDAEHEWFDGTCQDVTIDDVPVDLRVQSDLIPSLLCFWTSAATLRIKPLGINSFYNEYSTEMSDGTTHLIGLWPAVTKDFEYPVEGKFIIVSVEKERMSRGGNLILTLLWVEHDADLPSVCRRKRVITTVREEEWVKLNNREWQLMLLA